MAFLFMLAAMGFGGIGLNVLFAFLHSQKHSGAFLQFLAGMEYLSGQGSDFKL